MSEFEYVAKEEDELHLKPGDLITVIVSDEDDGWHKGVMGSRLGLFPLNVHDMNYMKRRSIFRLTFISLYA